MTLHYSLDLNRYDRQKQRPLFSPDGRPFDLTDMAAMRATFDWLVPVERDLLELLMMGKFQSTLGRMFGVTQQAISVRLKRSVARLQARLALGPAPSLDPVAHRLEPDQRRALALLTEGSFHSTVEALGLRRGVVHPLLNAAVAVLSGTAQGEYYARLRHIVRDEPRPFRSGKH